jgi:hypothetical protein
MQRVRQVTKKVQPREQAVWTLGDLYDYLCIWAFEVYDQTPHPAQGLTPAEAFKMGRTITGERTHVHYDDDFRYLSLPSTQKGTAKVEPGRGVKINYVYYNSKSFAHPKVEETPVHVRYDPFNIGVAYAHVQGNWVKCRSEHYLQLRGHTERERELASAELRKRNQNHGRGTPVTAKRLAEFLAAVETHEALLMQRLQDLEGRSVFAHMGSTQMLPYDEETLASADSLSLLQSDWQQKEQSISVLSDKQETEEEEEDFSDLEEYEEYK